jgi:hypothetical protein
MRGPRFQSDRIAFDAIQEPRAGQNPRESDANTGLEGAALLARLTEEVHRRFDVGAGHRPAIRPARQIGEDALRTGSLGGRGRRPTEEDPLAAGRGADTLDVVGALDVDRLQPRQPADHVYFLAVALRHLVDVLLLVRTLAPGEADLVRAGGDEHAGGHARVDHPARQVHVLGLRFVIGRTTDGRGVNLLAVDRHDEGVGRLFFDAGVPFLDTTHQTARELVFAVGRKDVAHHRAAAGPERKALDVGVLAELAADPVFGRAGPHVGVADGQRADALRGGEIPLEQERRGLQRRGNVVEPEVGAIARQQVGHVDIERQQVTNGVAVFGAVEPMNDVDARRALACPRAIERIPRATT